MARFHPSGWPFLTIKEKVLGKKYELSISFVSEVTAQELNATHRDKAYVPNTLSFSLSKSSGEIVMCIEAIKKEYKKFSMTYDKYLIFLLIHSMLHLKGMNHSSTMEDKERAVMKKFGLL